jgi:hypothetical protein
VKLFRTQTFIGSPLDVDLGARIAPRSHHGDGPKNIVSGSAALPLQFKRCLVDFLDDAGKGSVFGATQ